MLVDSSVNSQEAGVRNDPRPKDRRYISVINVTSVLLYRVYKKKLNRFEIALNFAKQLLVSSFLYIWLLWVLIM
jgi:hypothetical protein